MKIIITRASDPMELNQPCEEAVYQEGFTPSGRSTYGHWMIELATMEDLEALLTRVKHPCQFTLSWNAVITMQIMDWP